MHRITRDPAWTTEFERLGHTTDDHIDLAVAALLIAQSAYPDLEGESELEALEGMATVARQRIQEDGESNPLHNMNVIIRWLSDDLGFKGNHENFYDAKNSYINDILDRRLGIPISLSLIYIEVGRRAGVPLVGIGMPGNFLVGHSGIDDFFIDPFHDGSLISREEAKTLFRRMLVGAPINSEDTWSDTYLNPVTNKEFVIRMLRNLKGIHLRFQDYPQAVKILDMLVAMNASAPEERRDRGLIHFKLGNRAQALSDLKAFSDLQTPGLRDVTIDKIIQQLGS